jgi:mRNA interferase MazF
MKRGEVWLVNLDPTIGAEIKKTRPAAIVSHDALGKLPLRIIVPITTWQNAFESADWHVKIMAGKDNGLDRDSSADTFQVRSISENRLIRRLGELNDSEMEQIAQGLKLVLDLVN